jgi:hypothetical protein
MTDILIFYTWDRGVAEECPGSRLKLKPNIFFGCQTKIILGGGVGYLCQGVVASFREDALCLGLRPAKLKPQSYQQKGQEEEEGEKEGEGTDNLQKSFQRCGMQKYGGQQNSRLGEPFRIPTCE